MKVTKTSPHQIAGEYKSLSLEQEETQDQGLGPLYIDK
jgi:hypothetical protein